MSQLLVDQTRLPGVTVHTDRDERVVFIERRDGKFLWLCPHCEDTRWYRPHEDFDVAHDCMAATVAARLYQPDSAEILGR